MKKLLIILSIFTIFLMSCEKIHYYNVTAKGTITINYQYYITGVPSNQTSGKYDEKIDNTEIIMADNEEYAKVLYDKKLINDYQDELKSDYLYIEMEKLEYIITKQ